MSKEILRPTYRLLSLAVKYHSVLFPFDVYPFLRELSQQGFILPEPLEPVPLSSRFEVSGIVGRKEDIAVRLDTSRQVLGVYASSVNAALAGMDTLEALLKNELAFDSPGWAQYYEFLADLTIRTKKNPLESWQTHFAHTSIIEKFSEVLGGSVFPFGIRLAIVGETPNQVNWFDMRIEPSIQSATSHHFVEVIFRRSDRDKVIAFVRRFENILSQLFAQIEQS
jgi:hypothetical protein